MKKNKIQELLEKHIASDCNEPEQTQLAELVESTSDDKLEVELFQLFNKYEPTFHFSQKEKEEKLIAIMNSGKPTFSLENRSRKYYRMIASIAASVVILLSIGYYFTDQSDNLALKNHNTQQLQSKFATAYIRNIELPDGSMVILQKGSTVQLKKNFGSKTREVILNGEAYFDIKHMNSRPFIIHTGKVKTTVLGTAFNIKTKVGTEEVIVSVTRGKVKVENQNKVLAILTKNEQLNYNGAKAVEAVKKVEAEKLVTNWTKEDMVFKNESFENIVRTLNKRFGVNIIIKDDQLAKSMIVSSFSGTESLSNVLDVLCTLHLRTSYKKENQDIVISRN